MEPFKASFSTGTGLARLPAGSFPNQTGLIPPQSGSATDAGVRPARRTSDGDIEPGPLEMDVSPDLVRLLGLDAGHARQARAEPSDKGAGAMRNAEDLLQRRLTEARARIDRADTKTDLETRGVTAEQVLLQLQINADELRQLLVPRAAKGEVVFPLVPPATDLFNAAVRDAVTEAAWVAAQPVAVVTQAPAMAAADVAVQPVQALRDAPVDLAKRAEALQVLRDFEPRFHRRLLIHVMSRGPHYNEVARGYLEFRTAQDMLRLAPCASSIHWDTGYIAIYPRNFAPDGNILTVTLNHDVVLIARAENPHQVRYRDQSRIWVTTDVYTDDVVEAAKNDMWARIRAHSRILLQEIERQIKWMRWR